MFCFYHCDSFHSIAKKRSVWRLSVSETVQISDYHTASTYPSA